MNAFGDSILINTLRRSYPRAGVWLALTFYYMTRHVAEAFSLDDLASCSGVSKFNLCREFRNHTRLPPFQWLWRFRILLARELLSLPISWNIQEIAFRSGFSSPAHFSRAFKRVYGVSPGAYRRHVLMRRLDDTFVKPPLLDGFSCEVLRAAFEKAISN